MLCVSAVQTVNADDATFQHRDGVIAKLLGARYDEERKLLSIRVERVRGEDPFDRPVLEVDGRTIVKGITFTIAFGTGRLEPGC